MWPFRKHERSDYQAGIEGPPYAHAYECWQCPGRNDQLGCPKWWEITERDDDGNIRLTKGCRDLIEQRIYLEIYHKSLLAAESAIDARNCAARMERTFKKAIDDAQRAQPQSPASPANRSATIDAQATPASLNSPGAFGAQPVHVENVKIAEA